MGLSDFFSSLMPVVHADTVEAPAKDDTKSESKEEVAVAPAQEADEETPEPEDVRIGNPVLLTAVELTKNGSLAAPYY